MDKTKKLKICVYAISKNEEQFVQRWYNSMKEADEIYVLDTGSTDKTIELLKNNNVHVIKKEIIPFRFDIARNESLNLVPLDTDICVCTDLDEIFNKNWRKELEKNWHNSTRATYNYNWHFNEEKKPDISYNLNKIHARNNYKWIYPVHEVLKYQNKNEKIIHLKNITLNHYPDNNKSRKNYLPLLELALKENPNDERCIHYLAREYMYYNKNQKAIKLFKEHIKIATFKEEKSTSMRFMARCYIKKQNIKNAIKWYNNSIKETPYLRCPYVEKAILMFNEKQYNEVIYLCNKALDIPINNKKYINEPFIFNNNIYDLLSISYYYKNDIELANHYIDKVITMSPKDKRLKNNKEIFNQKE